MTKYPKFIRFAKSKFAKDNLLFISNSLIVGFLGYLFNFAVSRNISVAQYGELQSLFSILAIFGVYSSVLGYFIIKHVSVFAAHEDPGASLGFADFLLKKTRRFIFIFLIILIVMIPVLKYLLHLSDSWGLIAMGITILISLPAIIYGEILRGWNKFTILVFISIIAALAKLVSGIGLAVIFHNASVVSFSIFLAAVFSWFLSKYYSRKIMAPLGENSASKDWKEKYFSEINIRKTIIQIFTFSLGIILVSSLDMILVKSLMSPDDAGYYGALSILGKVIMIINMAVVAVVLPGACAVGYYGKRPNIKHILGSYGLIIISSLTLILLYYFWPQFIVSLLFGSKYVLQASNLWLFGIMSFFMSLVILEANLSFAKHEFRVVYFLFAIVAGMILGAERFHSNFREIVLVFSAVLLFGYFVILCLNLSQDKNKKNLNAVAKP
jgi:O-antigen/teichoic acid export membrane protein